MNSLEITECTFAFNILISAHFSFCFVSVQKLKAARTFRTLGGFNPALAFELQPGWLTPDPRADDLSEGVGEITPITFSAGEFCRAPRLSTKNTV